MTMYNLMIIGCMLLYGSLGIRLICRFEHLITGILATAFVIAMGFLVYQGASQLAAAFFL